MMACRWKCSIKSQPMPSEHEKIIERKKMFRNDVDSLKSVCTSVLFLLPFRNFEVFFFHPIQAFYSSMCTILFCSNSRHLPTLITPKSVKSSGNLNKIIQKKTTKAIETSERERKKTARLKNDFNRFNSSIDICGSLQSKC